MELKLDQCRTPEEWVEYLADERSIKISARSLRAKAREFGQCFEFGRRMLISPEQFDKIWELYSMEKNPSADVFRSNLGAKK